jgi:hypothetical protein
MHIYSSVFWLKSPPDIAQELVDKKLSPKYEYKVGKSVILWEYMFFNTLNTQK